ncbi:MAG: hypothetical protein H8K03_09330 [Nitrospira sp.]
MMRHALNFVIISENKGVPDPDVLPIEEEKLLLEEALKDSFAHLPQHLQIIAEQTVYVINHSRETVTKHYMGWSAEDDTEYRLGDKSFFKPSLDPRDPRNGSIKVNLSQKFMKTIAIGKILGKKDTRVLLGMRLLVRSILAHELLHAYQYSTNPVQALSNPIPPSNDCRTNCPEGLCDLKLIEGTKRKIEYERAAIALQRSYVAAVEYEAFANALDEYEHTVPDKFEKGSLWWLVSGRHETSLSNYYLRQYVKEREKGREFGELLRIVYEGQYIPPVLVYEIKSLNDQIEMGNVLVNERAKERLARILSEWKSFCEDGTIILKSRLQDPLPYLASVNQRFNLEIQRCNRLIERLHLH